CLQDTQLPRTF
nr:immunoglobulin light chain junction region [Macaca mulatta]MOV94133.1 immunoglobulin light chain junction region [Macaca mulatta]